MTGIRMQGIEGVFWFCALAGTVFFLARTAMLVLGGFGADDLSDAPETAVDAATDAGHSHQLEGVETSFKLVTLNTLTGFFMMFGWGALAAYRQFHFTATSSFVIGIAVGVAAMFATAYLFRAMLKLHDPGQSLRLEQLVGLSAQTYARIPAGGRGQVQVVVNQARHMLDAVADPGVEIDSFKDVRITAVRDDRTVVVRPAP